MLNRIFDAYGQEVAVRVADDIKDLGFRFATASGLSISVVDIEVPAQKNEILKEGDEQVNKIYSLYYK